MKSASQNTHTHTHARTQTITRARVLIPRKGACVAGRDSNPLRLHQWRSRDAETRTGKEVTLDQPGRGFFVVVSHHPAVYPFDIFSGPAIFFFYPHAGRISLVTAPNERGRERGENPGQISGEETGSYAGEESESPGSGCASLGCGGPRTEPDGARWSLPAHEKKGGSSEELTSPAGLRKKKIRCLFFLFFFGGNLPDHTLCSTHVGSGERRAGCLRVRDCSRRR